LEEHCRLRAEKSKELESMSAQGKTELCRGDETHVRSGGHVPYGWRFPEERVCFLAEKSYNFNCSGFISRNGQCRRQVTRENMDAAFFVELSDIFSFEVQRTTFIVLDNARIRKSKDVKERTPCRQKRGLRPFFLPPYSSHLDMDETLRRKLKKERLDTADYLSKDELAYAINGCLANTEKINRIKFSHFNAN
jgi:transposase